MYMNSLDHIAIVLVNKINRHYCLQILIFRFGTSAPWLEVVLGDSDFVILSLPLQFK